MAFESSDTHGVDPWAYLKHSLHVVHKCGHPAQLAYGSKTAAEDDRAAQEAQVCFSCGNSALVKAAEDAKRNR